MPPPEVKLVELELLKTRIEDKEVGLDGIGLVGSGEVGAEVGSGNDVEMEENNDDVNAEGSTENKLKTVLDLEDVQVNMEEKQEVIRHPGGNSMIAPSSKLSTNTLASNTVGTSLKIASQHLQSTNAPSTSISAFELGELCAFQCGWGEQD